MVTSSSVCMMIWANSPRAMLSSTPTFLLVSACALHRICSSICILSTPDYQPALSLVSHTANISDRLSTFNYSFQESCSLYPRCTPYFSVEHTVSPQSVVSNTSSGCSVEYTILNLMRCVSYQSTATALLGNQRGNTVIEGSAVMLSEWAQLMCTHNGGASRLDWEGGIYHVTIECLTIYVCLWDESHSLLVSFNCSLYSNGGHFLRSWSIHHHQCLYRSKSWPHQCGFYTSELWTFIDYCLLHNGIILTVMLYHFYNYML